MTNKTSRGLAVIFVLGWLWIGQFHPAQAEKSDISSSLKQQVLGDGRTLSEVQRFVTARIPAMPAVSTAREWEQLADGYRQDVLTNVVYRGEAARWRDAATKVEWLETIVGGPGYHLKKVRYEALPGLWIPAILYEPDKLEGKVPVALAVNGHEPIGKAVGYKQIRCINMAKRGMIVLNPEWFLMGQLRTEDFAHYRMNQIDLCGTSGVAPFYLSMKRGLDLLLSLPHADPARVCVSGLSGGGWQTIIISALDTRVTLANPVAGYSSFHTRAVHPSDLGDSEQMPTDLAMYVDYLHLTAMRVPRPTLLTYNAKDQCCFASGHALQPLLDAAGPVYRLFGMEDRFRSHINNEPGTHNYELENREVFYQMLGDFFFTKIDTPFNAKEISSELEVKTPEMLNVPVPEDNKTFHALALELSRDLPRTGRAPEEKDKAATWRDDRRTALSKLVRYRPYQVTAEQHGRQKIGETDIIHWRLIMGDDWTVPATELTEQDVCDTTILLSDEGRLSLGPLAACYLHKGERVIAMDPFYFGEAKINQRDPLWALMVATVGERTLGIQAGQIAAVARWTRSQNPERSVSLVAVGPRTSTMALIAAAIEEKAITKLELFEPLKSLKEVIERNWTMEQTPELFCFGLLEQFDIEHLATMVAPRPLLIHAARPQTAPSSSQATSGP